VQAIHVTDRGADSYALFAELVAAQRRFVIRLRRQGDRLATSTWDADEWETLREVADRARYVTQRTVTLSHRRAKTVRTTHGPREKRRAILHLEVTRVILRKPRYLTDVPPELDLWMVRVHEVDTPPGEDPVEWWLVTSEPVATQEEVEAVVDWYRARWKIEEYFKALKTGCGWRNRHVESRRGLFNALALMIPIAAQLLAARDLYGADANAPATTVFSERQLKVLRSLARRPVPKDATIEQAVYAIAGEGGHLKRNGRPGWQTLGAGLERLWWAELGYVIALHEQRQRA
jgi:hypothetical protein